MMFFSNPKRSRKRGRTKISRRRKSRRRVRRVARSSPSGGSMARRRRARRTSARRRRRRSTARKAIGVSVRRRGVVVYQGNPRRRRVRRYRRNPGMGSVVSTLKNGVKDGAVVLVSQVATRKAINFVSGVNPIKGVAGAAVAGLLVPVAVTIAARKMVPSQSRLISAGAFAEGLRSILSNTPVAPFLSGGTEYAEADTLNAYPDAIPAGMGAWPGASATFGDATDDVMVQ